MTSDESNHLRVFVIARAISVLGSAIAPIALAFAVLDGSGSLGELGLVLAARLMPQVLLTFVGGWMADHYDRSSIMAVCSVGSAAAQVAAAALLLSGQNLIALLVLTQVVAGCFGAVFYPASAGIVPHLVPAHGLKAANARLFTAMNAAMVIGPIIGGILVATTGPGVAILCDAGAFVLSAILLFRLRAVLGGLPKTTAKAGKGTGLSIISNYPWCAWVVGGTFVWFLSVNAAISTLGPLIADQTLDGAAAWGRIVAASGVGLVIGSWVAGRIRVDRPLVLSQTVLLATCVFPALLAWYPAEAWLWVAAVIYGVGVGVNMTLWRTTVQQVVPVQELGRLSSWEILPTIVGNPIGLIIVPIYAGQMGVDNTLLLCAGSVIVTQLLMLGSRSVRSLRTPTAELSEAEITPRPSQ